MWNISVIGHSVHGPSRRGKVAVRDSRSLRWLLIYRSQREATAYWSWPAHGGTRQAQCVKVWWHVQSAQHSVPESLCATRVRHLPGSSRPLTRGHQASVGSDTAERGCGTASYCWQDRRQLSTCCGPAEVQQLEEPTHTSGCTAHVPQSEGEAKKAECSEVRPGYVWSGLQRRGVWT